MKLQTIVMGLFFSFLIINITDAAHYCPKTAACTNPTKCSTSDAGWEFQGYNYKPFFTKGIYNKPEKGTYYLNNAYGKEGGKGWCYYVGPFPNTGTWVIISFSSTTNMAPDTDYEGNLWMKINEGEYACNNPPEGIARILNTSCRFK